MTRWEALFSDLEAQVATQEVAERAAEIEERTRYEVGRLRLVDRLRASIGGTVRLACEGGIGLCGRVEQVGPDWVLLAESAELGAAGEAETVVRLARTLTVSGLMRTSSVPESESVVSSRLGVRTLLRGLARDRSGLRVHLADGQVATGTLERVGADYVELAQHAPVRPPGCRADQASASRSTKGWSATNRRVWSYIREM